MPGSWRRGTVAFPGIKECMVTLFVMRRSPDVKGTTILIACLSWGYLWNLAGLVLDMPITVPR
jgi:hypothetical protein